jgi:DNA-directed RNA polymerase I subunit RPA2
MLPISRIPPPASALPVILDGRIVGHVPAVLTPAVAQQLRLAKTMQNTLPHPVFDKLEIAVFLHSPAAGSPAPGIFLFSSAGRMLRPVMNVAARRQEWIGPFEQISMGISVTPEAFDAQLHTHVETCPTNMLSAIASFTPYSDMNQSPRNMCVKIHHPMKSRDTMRRYQCQQTKQSMGMPFHAFDRRTDNKVRSLAQGLSFFLLFPAGLSHSVASGANRSQRELRQVRDK